MVARNIELTAQLEHYVALFLIDIKRSGAVFLVVVGFGNRGAPVDHKRTTLLIGNACGTDVDVAGSSTRAHLKADLGKVGLQQQQQNAAELVDRKVVLLVVGIDNGVERLDGGKRLHRFVDAHKVGTNLLGHILKIGGGSFLPNFELVGECLMDLLELLVGLG